MGPDIKEIIPTEVIEQNIFIIRGHKVMLSAQLAKLYGVETKVLIQAVKRNVDRFPEDFMFQLTWDEVANLKSQNVTLKSLEQENSRSQNVTLKQGRNIKYLPYAFTEQGVAMLSSVLNNKRAIHVNIQIMRTFTKLRRMLLDNEAFRQKIETMEKKYDYQFQVVFEAIKRLLDPEQKSKEQIGFRPNK